MVAKGYPNKTIAAVLEISSWTVCTHLRRMFAKLGVSSRAAMVARMMDTDMLDRHQPSFQSGTRD
jgi:DNA-binding CsgD family transcriptional regulator